MYCISWFICRRNSKKYNKFRFSIDMNLTVSMQSIIVCWQRNVSHCQQKQSYSGLRSPEFPVPPDDRTQPTFEMTPGFKPFTEMYNCWITGCVQLGNMDLDFEIQILDLQSKAQSEMCLWISVLSLFCGNLRKDLKNKTVYKDSVLARAHT